MSRLSPPVAGRFEYDGTDTNNIYIGWAAVNTQTSSSSWRIAKLIKTGAGFSLKHPSGSSEFSFIWDNRTSYSYS